MGHDRLENHFKTNFALMHYHKWNLEYLDKLVPWERYVYVDLLFEYLKEEEKKAQLKEQEYKAQIASIQRQINARQNK